MKNSLLLLIGFTLILASCGTEKAEMVADDFHKHIDDKDYAYICDNLVDDEADEDLPAQFATFLEQVDSWGDQTNRVKETGFSQKSNNGVTTVKFDYSFDTPDYHLFESIVLVNRADGYKIVTCVMNTDKEAVEESTADY